VSTEAVAAWEQDVVPPGDVLIAADLLARDHDRGPGDVGPMQLIVDYGDLQEALAAVVTSAQESLAITGSRSRDPDHLARVEAAVADRPTLIHYRVLYGPPRHAALKNHLLRLVGVRAGAPTLHIGMVHDLLHDGERFICACESQAVVVLPSLMAPSNFDTGLHITDPSVARRLVTHVRQAYLGADALIDRAAIEHLAVVR
jgi:hypothetical protein